MSMTTFFQPDAPPPGTHFHYIVAISESETDTVIDSAGFSDYDKARAYFNSEVGDVRAGYTVTFGRVELTDRERRSTLLPETVSHRAKWLADKGWATGCVIERKEL